MPSLPLRKYIPWDTAANERQQRFTIDRDFLPPYEAHDHPTITPLSMPLPDPGRKPSKLQLKTHERVVEVEVKEKEYVEMAPAPLFSKRKRPLPSVPALLPPSRASDPGFGPPPGHRHQRRASGSHFFGGAPHPKGNGKAPGWIICNRNENDSPISPDSPLENHFGSFAPSPSPLAAFPDLSRLSAAVKPIPMTPLTPGFAMQQSAEAETSMSMMSLRTPMSPAFNFRARPKRNGRLGFAAGIPPEVLEELRTMGEAPAPSPDTPVHPSEGERPEESDSSSSEGELDEEEFYAGYGSDSMTLETKSRSSLHWIRDLGDDRWMAESYSNILRAL